jgi:hypothetical protein
MPLSEQNARRAGLQALVSYWLEVAANPASPEVRSISMESGLSVRCVREALRSVFVELQPEKIEAYLKQMGASGREHSRYEHVLHVAPSNVFTAWLHGTVISFLLGAQSWIKPSSTSQVFPRLWIKSIQEKAPALFTSFKLCEWSAGVLDQTQAVVVYGSDETLATIRQQLRPDQKLIGYGHRWSVGVIWGANSSDSSVLSGKLKRAIEPFRLAGCLSPQKLFVRNGIQLDTQLPKGTPLPEIISIETLDEVVSYAETQQGHLSCLGYSGGENLFLERDQRWKSLGFSRICRIEEMQQPPLSWENGGVSLWKELQN